MTQNTDVMVRAGPANPYEVLLYPNTAEVQPSTGTGVWGPPRVGRGERRRQRLSWRLSIVGIGRVVAPPAVFALRWGGRGRVHDPDLWLVLDDADLELLEADDLERRRRDGGL